MNKVCIIGRLVAKPELKKTTSNRSMCPFTIACNGANNNTEFIDCIAWGKQAENLCEYQEKGNLVGIDGRITTNTYENKDGYKIKKYVVSVDNVEFLSTRPKVKDANVETNDADVYEEFGKEIDIENNFLD